MAITKDLWKCPACGMPQFKEFDECPQCGIIVAKYTPKGKTTKNTPNKRWRIVAAIILLLGGTLVLMTIIWSTHKSSTKKEQFEQTLLMERDAKLDSLEQEIQSLHREQQERELQRFLSESDRLYGAPQRIIIQRQPDRQWSNREQSDNAMDTMRMRCRMRCYGTQNYMRSDGQMSLPRCIADCDSMYADIPDLQH